MKLNIKPKFIAVIFSLTAMTLCAAPKQETVRKFSSKEEASASLKNLSGQLQGMQDQINMIKSTQNSLTSEALVKNVISKLRRMEVQVEYLDKRMKEIPNLSEMRSLAKEHLELKTQINSLSDGSPPNLAESVERLQQQMAFLYNKYKDAGFPMQSVEALPQSTQNPSYSHLQDQLVALQQQLSTQLQTIQAIIGSKESLANFGSSLDTLKIQMTALQGDHLKDFDRISQTTATLEKMQANLQEMHSWKEGLELVKGSLTNESLKQEELKRSLNEISNRLYSVQSVYIAAETKLQKIEELDRNLGVLNEAFNKANIGSFSENVDKMRKQISFLYRGYREDLKTQEAQKTELLQMTHNLKDLKEVQLVALQDELKNFKENINTQILSNTTANDLQSLKEELSVVKTSTLSIDKLKKQSQFLYQKLKSFKFDEYMGAVSKASADMEKIQLSLQELQIWQEGLELVKGSIASGTLKQEEFQKTLNDINDRINSVDLQSLKEELSAVKTSTLSIEKLKKQSQFLYQKLKSFKFDEYMEKIQLSLQEVQFWKEGLELVKGSIASGTLKQEEFQKTLNDINDRVNSVQSIYVATETKLQKVEEFNLMQLVQDLKDLKETQLVSLQNEIESLKKNANAQGANGLVVSDVQALKEELSIVKSATLAIDLETIRKEIAEAIGASQPSEGSLTLSVMQEELLKRDEEIAKLKRRILYLYKNSKESGAEQALDERFENLKKEMQASVLEYLHKAQNDQPLSDNQEEGSKLN